MTKPAGCFIQLLGGALLLIGLSMGTGGKIGGYVSALIGLFLLIWSGLVIRERRKIDRDKKLNK